MAELKPKRGFVDLDHWDVIGEDSVIQPIIWDDRSDDGSDVCVLLIPDPDRDPTPEEIEALAERLYEDARPVASKADGLTFAPWSVSGSRSRKLWCIYASAAWRLGARVPS